MSDYGMHDFNEPITLSVSDVAQMTDYDFDPDGQLIINGQVISHGDLLGMLELYYDGHCRICNCEIPDDGCRTCNECFDKEATRRR